MNWKKTLAFSFLLTLPIWLFFSWPLPEYLFSGIPASSTNIEKDGVRRMLAGDQLQLEYFYWLFSDMLAGHTPPFHNLYEFNVGDDAARRRVGHYNLPFSLVYAVVRPLAGRAFAWNLVGFLTLWMTHLLSWRLLRRFTASEWLAGLFALVAITVPYRWIALCGGSPTGFAMVWVPLLVLGLDAAGRDDNWRGALLASAALGLSYLNDRHVFFFCVLSTPLWYLVGLLRRESLEWRKPQFRLSLLRAVSPLLVGLAVVLAIAAVSRHTAFHGTNMAQGRALAEICSFSADPVGLIKWRGVGTDGHVYVGYILPLLLLAHAFASFFAWTKGRAQPARLLVCVLVWAGTILTVMLALGPKGPFDGALFEFYRGVVPGYGMIRQSDKIYCLLPTFVALAALLAVGDLFRPFRGRRAASSLICAVPVLIAVEHGLQVRTTVCLLDREQAAYAAVARDASERNMDPRALILPIWPGDSAWASLYEYYVSLYRIRMVNGYTPVVPNSYKEDVFLKLTSANVGLLSDAQLSWLRSRGVEYVVLHENAFPEQVSPFPVFFTLKRLLEHPRLELLRQSEGMWAFRILEAAATRQPVTVPSEVNFSSKNRQWEAESLPQRRAAFAPDEQASAGGAVRLDQPGGSVQGKRVSTCETRDGNLLFRAKGHGTISLALEDKAPPREVFAIDTDTWQWRSVPVEPGLPFIAPRFEWKNGAVLLDMLQFIGGNWTPPEAGAAVSFPACLFFHAGVIDPRLGSVTFRPEWEADSVIFFGPRLPFEPGDYEALLTFETPAPAGTRLGFFTITDGSRTCAPQEVLAGSPASAAFRQESNLPVTLRFTYSRNASMTMKEVTFNRLR